MGFYGDLLKILAHTGLQTGGNIATQMIAGPMIAERQGQQKVLESLLPTMSSPTASEEERQAVAKTVEGITKTAWPTAVATNPAGTEIKSSGGAALTAPRGMDLSALAPGESVVNRLVRPPASLESMKTDALAGMTPADRTTALFPADERLGLAREKLEAYKDKWGADLGMKKYMADQTTETRRMGQELNASIRQMGQQNLDLHRSQLLTNAQRNLDRLEAGDLRKGMERELSQFTALQNQYALATGKDKDKIAAQLNTLISGSQNPYLQTFPQYAKDEYEGGINFPIIGNVGGTKTTKPIGVETTKETPMRLSPQEQELQRRGYKKDPATGQWSK